MRSHRLLASCAFCGLLLTVALAADPQPGAVPVGPLSPREELATFKVPKGFKVELVASEPEVVDPVAIAFDEDGRLFVAEMRGYPNAGVATGNVPPEKFGKIKMLEDPDGSGVYKKSSTFADGLRFPTSVMPYKGGLLAAIAPDIIHFDGPDGTGKSKGQRVLYTGFTLDNIQQLINGLQWGLDNWVYGCAGGNGGTIRSVEKPDMPAVTLRSRGIRFHPEVPGSLEPTSSGGQFGLTADDWERWFTNTNSQHLRHIVLPDHYLRRNPYLAVPAVTLDIPDHGAVCKVFRISPFEAWRVERTTQRAGAVDSKRFPASELVPGGFTTSACSPVVYTASLFPEAYRGNIFSCEPANNLVHRDILVGKGATFSAQRGETDCDFLASTDIWFRPVNLTVGPEGAIYVVDFYREVIETPLSLPEAIRKKYNLESRARGRIWRIVPEDFKQPKKPALGKASTEELVQQLANPNAWWRLTAQRLLMARQDKAAIKGLEKLAREAGSGPGRAHALWTLHGLKALEDSLIFGALKDPVSGVREQALRLAEGRLAANAELRKAVTSLAGDEDPRVRFQLAFTLGESDAPEVGDALAKILRRDAADNWTQLAILSSSSRTAPSLLEALGRDKEFTRTPGAPQLQLLTRLASLVGAHSTDADLARALGLLGEEKEGGTEWQVAILTGLGQGLQNSQRSLRQLWEQPPAGLKEAVARAEPFFKRAATAALDEKRPPAERVSATRLLSSGPFAIAAPPLQQMLSPQSPADLQLAAVRALSVQDNPKVPELLLAQWGSFGPAVRREVLEALFGRADRLRQLLDSIEQKKVLASQLEPARVDLLRKHPDVKVRERALKLLAGRAAPDRQKIVDEYKPALDLKGDSARGKLTFKKVCSTCHRLENEGTEVGPDLLSALKTKTPEALVVDILDPSREVDPRYINYVVSTKAGRVLTGIIAVEAPSSITLRRAEKAEDTILRNQIDEIQATAKSLMPDELEKQLSKQDLADVIAYLLSVVSGK